MGVDEKGILVIIKVFPFKLHLCNTVIWDPFRIQPPLFLGHNMGRIPVIIPNWVDLNTLYSYLINKAEITLHEVS